MGKPTGFLEYERETSTAVSPLERIKNFKEFHTPLSMEEQQTQAARCMECGVPFCQAGLMLPGGASGCPLNNLVPEWNDLVYHGNWEEAYYRLKKTNNFPEFTSRVCPALCEAACTCGLNGDAVTTKENELCRTASAKGKNREENCCNRFRSFGTGSGRYIKQKRAQCNCIRALGQNRRTFNVWNPEYEAGKMGD